LARTSAFPYFRRAGDQFDSGADRVTMTSMMGPATGRRLTFVVAVALLLSGTAGFAQAPAPLPGEPPPLAPPAGGVTPEIRAQLTPRQYTTLSSEMAGRIDSIAAKVGAHFQKGDVLIEFDCAVQRAQERSASAVLMRAEKTYTIDQRLVALKSMGQLELDIAGAEVEKAKAEVAAAAAVTSKCTITAPFSGVTAEQKARAFQYTTPGQALLDILDDHGLEIELIAPSRWLSWLKPGYGFQVHVDETSKDYPAKVTRLGGRVDPISQSIKVIGEITGDAPELMAGMSGRATITPP
jgi:membrane fusion protein, multidrug efflux system